MFDWKSPAEWKRVFRYYQAGIVNTAFGYGLFAALVYFGLNLYIAQIISHILGMLFNYLTYSRYAFADHSARVSRYILSYAVNYMFSLGALYAFSRFIASPYAAGLLATVLVSAINYLVLRKLVFTEKTT